MIDQTITKDARTSLVEMMFKDIEDAFNGTAMMGAAILTMCAIDTLGVLFYEKDAPLQGEKKTFVHFMQSRYMDRKYKKKMTVCLWNVDTNNFELVHDLPLAFYRGMRCLLVHNYSACGFRFRHNIPKSHLRRVRPEGDNDPHRELININLNTLIDDVKKATMAYCNDLERDGDIYNRFVVQTGGRPLLNVKDRDEDFEIYDEEVGSWENFKSWSLLQEENVDT